MRAGIPLARSRARRGITFPFVVLLLATFIGVAAFAIDFSRMFIIHGQLQTAAEAGALAGAERMINHDGSHASDTAIAYARLNLTENVAPEVAAGDVTFGHFASDFVPTSGWSDPNTNAIRVTTHHTGRYVFGPIYNFASKALSANAVASLGSISAAACIRPIAIPYSDLLKVLYPTNTPPVSYNLTESDVQTLSALTQANKIILKVGDPSATIVGGNFYAVREPPIRYADGTAGDPWNGGNDYEDALKADCIELPQVIARGDWLQAEQRNKQGPTRSGLGVRCGLGEHPPQTFDCSPPVPYLVPIWDIYDKSVASPNSFRVKYLGVFKATGYSKDGINGYFSTLTVDGKYDTLPGPLPKAVLRR